MINIEQSRAIMKNKKKKIHEIDILRMMTNDKMIFKYCESMINSSKFDILEYINCMNIYEEKFSDLEFLKYYAIIVKDNNFNNLLWKSQQFSITPTELDKIKFFISLDQITNCEKLFIISKSNFYNFKISGILKLNNKQLIPIFEFFIAKYIILNLNYFEKILMEKFMKKENSSIELVMLNDKELFNFVEKDLVPGTFGGRNSHFTSYYNILKQMNFLS